MLWVSENPRRLLAERAALEELQSSEPWIKGIRWGFENELLKVSVQMAIGGVVYDADLIYPEMFPEIPPIVLPQDRKSRWSGHQYGPGGALCLEWRADNWHPDITGAELLRSTYRLLSTERPGAGLSPGRVLSAHRVTRGQELRSSWYRAVLSARLQEYLGALPVPTLEPATSHMLFHDTGHRILVGTSVGEGDARRAIDDVPSAMSSCGVLFQFERKGWIAKGSGIDPSRSFTDTASLIAHLHEAGFADFAFPAGADTAAGNKYVFIIVGANNTSAVVEVDANGEAAPRSYAVLAAEKHVVGRRTASRLATVSQKRVAIVGCGSMGSKVAVTLARCGLRKFLLIDDDLLMPENLCRHELDWSEVGMHKAEGLSERLSLIAAGMEVTTSRLRLGGQESSESIANALALIGSYDLILDATASPNTFVQLAAAARRFQRVMVWGELYPGGAGGLVARSRPIVDLPALEMRASIHETLRKFSPAPDQAAIDYDDIEGEPAIASDADVSHLAAIISQLCIDALAGGPSDFPYCAYHVGFKKYWVFEQPFDTQPIDVPAPDMRVQPTAADPDALREAVAFVTALAGERAGA
jgi:molybdopterin/thiamine biosynthesis adenylyltransferase